MKTLFQILFLFAFVSSKSQTATPTLLLSQDGIFDNVVDKDGNKYSLASINVNYGKQIGNSSYSTQSVSSCTAGYFVLDFVPGSYLGATSAAQSVVCQVFKDISGFIYSPLVSPTYIHIICGDAPTGYLGVASSYYIFPNSPANPNQGIIDGQIYKALISGTDPYQNIPITSFSTSSLFYHGYVNIGSAYTWNLSMNTTTIATGEYDLYTTVLHEVMHSLGLNSLINVNGYSKMGSGNNYYTRYDKFLYSFNGTQLLTTSTPTCSSCNLTATTVLTGIAPGLCTNTTVSIADISTCSLATKYVSAAVTITVYTPNCFESSSSLMHFEDMCTVPNTFTSACTPTPNTSGMNNLYFVMSNANSTSSLGCFVKRYLKPEERKVLRDLGYSVNSTYTSNAAIDGTNTSISYTGGACSPSVLIYGQNDGLVGTTYIYTTSSASIAINYTTLLSNDTPSNVLTVECMESIYNTATLSPSVTDFTVSAGIGSGLQILKYYPRTSTGLFGNVTYVFIYFTIPCVPSGTCNIVENQGFENQTTVGCGNITPGSSPLNLINCWQPNFGNPILLRANCTTPSLFSSCVLDINTSGIAPPLSSHNGTINNTSVMELSYMFPNMSQSLKTQLSAPLIPGQNYQISLWFLNRAQSISSLTLWNPNSQPCVLSIACFSVLQFVPSQFFPTGLTPLISFTANAGTTWTQYTGTFAVPSGTVNQSMLVIGINGALTNAIATLTNDISIYGFLDDVVITPMPTPSFNPPSAICGNTQVNLASYASTTGTFTGASPSASSCITYTNGSSYFNFTPTLSSGYYPIAFTYTVAGGCTYTLAQSIYYLNNCCSSSGLAAFTDSSVPTYTALTGPMRIANDFTVQSGATCNFQPGEFIMENTAGAGIKITVASGAVLNINGAHLYTCGNVLWKGIVIQSGGRVQTLPAGGNDCLIEDAETAFDITSNTSTLNPLDLHNTIFNKNYVSINIFNNFLYSSPVSLEKCVFTCRDFSFTSSSWPTVSTSSGGLLFSTTNTATPLASPYALQSATITNLKYPYGTHRSHIAIKIEGVGLTTGSGYPLTFGNLDLTPQNDFTLFDAHEYFISSINSNVKISNSVFQNTQTFSVSSTTTVGAAIDYSCSNITAYQPNSSINIYELDLSASIASLGNRFYDCHRAIVGNNPFSFKLVNATIRSTHLVSNATNTAVVSTGKSAVFMRTNQVEDYTINNNQFNNVTDGVVISLYPANVMRPGMPYIAGPPQYFYINAYIHTLTVIGNTFTPEDNITFTGTGPSNGYVKNAINISSDPYNLTVPYCGCTGIHVEDNNLYRVMNGITLNAINPYTVTCKNVGVKKIIRRNVIKLEEDNIFGGITQHGIEFVNSISEPVQNGQRLQTIESNTILVYGNSSAQSNTNISLYYGNSNGGTGTLFPTPHILCNDLRNANKGFVFENKNIPASWRHNIMEDLKMAMVLTGTAGGVIGQQGDQGNPSDNIWSTATTWSGSYYGTWVDIASDAKNSMLYIRSGSPWTPQNNSGNILTLPQQLYGAVGTISLAIGSYVCGADGNYTLMNSPAPGSGTLTDEPWYISATFAYRYLVLNDSMRNADGDLLDFYNNLAGTSIDDFMQIEMKINEREFSAAQSILEAINTSGFNGIETAYFSFYSLSLKYKIGVDEFTPDDLGALKSIAGLCPGNYGSLVYQARALYQLITEEVFSGTDGCAESGARMGQPEKSLPKTNSEQWDVSLFPNPNNGNFAIISKNEKEILELTISDIAGREVYENKVETKRHVYVLEIPLPNGTYFIKIKNQANETVTKKLVLAK